jgi:hypothetical protein
VRLFFFFLFFFFALPLLPLLPRVRHYAIENRRPRLAAI